MTAMRLSRLSANDIRDAGPIRRGVLRLYTLIGRFRRRDDSTLVPNSHGSAEAPWVAEMFSAFGALFPFADPSDDSRRGHAECAASPGRRNLHLS